MMSPRPHGLERQRQHSLSREQAVAELRDAARNDRESLGRIEFHQENHWLASGVTLRSLVLDGLAQCKTVWGEKRYRVHPRLVRRT